MDLFVVQLPVLVHVLCSTCSCPLNWLRLCQTGLSACYTFFDCRMQSSPTCLASRATAPPLWQPRAKSCCKWCAGRCRVRLTHVIQLLPLALCACTSLSSCLMRACQHPCPLFKGAHKGSCQVEFTMLSGHFSCG